ncbi:methylated-DNA--[protein]-cysteine S-methyltransferase [Georgenia alba]|uniref:Methylated-DNA--[protein]-cysteine S-methyltransferase n=1 Tax=Georgenia alba TaxID=2233858 RepID=A0ABW2Q5X0_9MICO
MTTATATTAAATTLETPDGPFSIVVADGAVLASGWTAEVGELVALIHPGLRPADVRSGSRSDGLGEASDAVAAYYDGDHAAPGRVTVRQRSGSYRELAWEALRGVPAGERVTYTELARRSGRPAAVRAAAGACARNAAALFVPCHRVLRTDGTLGGFRYGTELKERLLGRERAAATP